MYMRFAVAEQYMMLLLLVGGIGFNVEDSNPWWLSLNSLQWKPRSSLKYRDKKLVNVDCSSERQKQKNNGEWVQDSQLSIIVHMHKIDNNNFLIVVYNSTWS